MLLLRLEREKGLVGQNARSCRTLCVPSPKRQKTCGRHPGRFSHPFSHIPIDVCTVVDLPVPQGKTCGLVLEDRKDAYKTAQYTAHKSNNDESDEDVDVFTNSDSYNTGV